MCSEGFAYKCFKNVACMCFPCACACMWEKTNNSLNMNQILITNLNVFFLIRKYFLLMSECKNTRSIYILVLCCDIKNEFVLLL